MNASAACYGYVRCTVCGRLEKIAANTRCPRCDALLHRRKPDSLQRSLALLIAAAVLYIPANLLPIMETGSLFGVQRDTIMSGVVYFWTSGSWELAFIIFFASVAVPMLKLVSLFALIITVREVAAVSETNQRRPVRPGARPPLSSKKACRRISRFFWCAPTPARCPRSATRR